MSKRLFQAVSFSEERISINEVTLENYITTDNLLQDKQGKKNADKMPLYSGNLTKYIEEDILVSNIRPYLKKIWFATQQGGCSNDVLVFRVNPEYCPKFIYYSIFRDDFFVHAMKGAKGTKMPRGDKNQILQFNMPLIGIEQQKQIASVLSALDDKIELNKKINVELEAMAKTIYDYWFVQFDFPNEEGKPYKSSGGAMIWNEELKREIPKGWEVNHLSDWIETDKSGDWGKDEKQGNYTKKVSCIRGADINGLNGTGELKAPERFILVNNALKILNEGDIIVEISGGSPTQSTGRIAFVTNETLERFANPLICSNFCKALSLKDSSYLFNFVYEWNRIYDAGVLFGYEGKTSGIKNLLFDNFVNSYFVVNPPKTIVNKFHKMLEQIHAKKQKNLFENQQLTSLRDWLLPMLMNGQVKVGRYEQEEAVAMVAEMQVGYKNAEINTSEYFYQRFNLWLSNQGLVARGDIDKITLREIFDAMDDEDK